MKKRVLSFALAGILTVTAVAPTAALATPAITEKPVEIKVQETLNVSRIKGQDRYDTAIKASQATFPKGSKYVAIATGENFVDGLVGGAITSHHKFPLLLVQKNVVTKDTLEEIKRLNPQEIFIFGGEAAVSKNVEAEIEKLGIKIERLGGSNRLRTAVKIEHKRNEIEFPNADPLTPALALGQETAVINAFDFADALSAGPFIGRYGKIPFLPHYDNHPNEFIYMAFGGTTAVPKGKYEEYRFAGANRYETAVEVAKAYKDFLKLDIDTVVLVSGEDFPDGLTAAEIAGVETAAVLLTQKGVLSPTTKAYIEGNANIKNVIILGGEAAVSEAVEKELKTIKVTAPTAKTEAKAEDKAKAKTDVKTETVKEEPKGAVVVDSAVNND